ncbi:hypothetical protein KFE98_19110 [bacterium SCSIO 12741]|nr:hypothetical protein KFE98_19110 [bacterium SCSIO 12741]
MISLFLRAKHWQFFLLFVAIPFGVHSFNMTQLILNTVGSNTPEFDNAIGVFRGFVGVATLSFFGLFGWFWSIYFGLKKSLPAQIKFPDNRFRFFLLFPAIYIALLLFYFLSFINSFFSDAGEIEPVFIGMAMTIVIPLHLISVFGMFHSLYWVAKTIKTAEMQRKVDFSEFVGEFFLIWFNPIGIWIVQPKVNRLFEHPPEVDEQKLDENWERRTN